MVAQRARAAAQAAVSGPPALPAPPPVPESEPPRTVRFPAGPVSACSAVRGGAHGLSSRTPAVVAQSRVQSAAIVPSSRAVVSGPLPALHAPPRPSPLRRTYFSFLPALPAAPSRRHSRLRRRQSRRTSPRQRTRAKMMKRSPGGLFIRTRAKLMKRSPGGRRSRPSRSGCTGEPFRSNHHHCRNRRHNRRRNHRRNRRRNHYRRNRPHRRSSLRRPRGSRRMTMMMSCSRRTRTTLGLGRRQRPPARRARRRRWRVVAAAAGDEATCTGGEASCYLLIAHDCSARVTACADRGLDESLGALYIPFLWLLEPCVYVHGSPHSPGLVCWVAIGGQGSWPADGEAGTASERPNLCCRVVRLCLQGLTMLAKATTPQLLHSRCGSWRGHAGAQRRGGSGATAHPPAHGPIPTASRASGGAPATLWAQLNRASGPPDRERQR
jgi:hypothetical protein